MIRTRQEMITVKRKATSNEHAVSMYQMKPFETFQPSKLLFWRKIINIFVNRIRGFTKDNKLERISIKTGVRRQNCKTKMKKQ